MTDILLLCEECGKQFLRVKKEYSRNLTLGRKMFCNLSCRASHNNRIQFKTGVRKPNLCLTGQSGNRKDEFSSFRYYLNKARSSERVRNYGETDLNLKYLKDLWDEQKGICKYTGKLMRLPQTTRDSQIKSDFPTKASLDRIDSSKGYVQGNVEFVCIAVNLAKAQFSRQIMIDFFSEMRHNR